MKKRDSELGRAASVVQRLAVLLAAGVPPHAAWEYLPRDEFVDTITRFGAPLSVPDAIVQSIDLLTAAEGTAWRAVATAWAVATDAGAPLSPMLRHLAASLRDLAEAQRQVRVALAAPVATARLVVALPAVGLLFGTALGFDSLGVLFTTVPGLVCLAAGAALITAGWGWNRRLVRAAQPTELTPGLEFDLIAIAVSGGASLGRATASVAASVERFSPGLAVDSAAVDEILELSRRAGVPSGELLRSEAVERRRVARAASQEAAQRLSVRLMIPLGVCVLPAFMLLGVVPLVISVVSSSAVRL